MGARAIRCLGTSIRGRLLMNNAQVENLEEFLTWLKTCPNHYTISSMQGGFVHVKFLISVEKKREEQ